MLSLMIGNIFWMTLVIFIFFMAVYINSVLKFLFISYRKKFFCVLFFDFMEWDMLSFQLF